MPVTAQPHPNNAPVKNKRHRKTKHCVLVLWADHFDELAAVTFTTQLRSAGIRVLITALHQQRIKGAHGIAIYTDIALNQVTEKVADQVTCILIPSGSASLVQLENEPRISTLLKRASFNRAKVVFCCSKAFEPKKLNLPLGNLDVRLVVTEQEELHVSASQFLNTLL